MRFRHLQDLSPRTPPPAQAPSQTPRFSSVSGNTLPYRRPCAVLPALRSPASQTADVLRHHRKNDTPPPDTRYSPVSMPPACHSLTSEVLRRYSQAYSFPACVRCSGSVPAAGPHRFQASQPQSPGVPYPSHPQTSDTPLPSISGSPPDRMPHPSKAPYLFPQNDTGS